MKLRKNCPRPVPQLKRRRTKLNYIRQSITLLVLLVVWSLASVVDKIETFQEIFMSVIGCHSYCDDAIGLGQMPTPSRFQNVQRQFRGLGQDWPCRRNARNHDWLGAHIFWLLGKSYNSDWILSDCLYILYTNVVPLLLLAVGPRCFQVRRL